MDASIDEHSRRRPPRRARFEDENDLSQAEIDDDAHHVAIIDSDDESENEPEKKRKKTAKEEESALGVEATPEAEDSCSICFEAFDSHGSHRLVSLRCGHFFGENCVVRWLQGERGRGCPTCKATAKIKDIRQHFAAAVRVVDNGELEEVRASCSAYKKDNEHLRLRTAALSREIDQLKSSRSFAMNTTIAQSNGQFFFECRKRILLNKSDGSRAMDFNGEILVVGVRLAASSVTEEYGIGHFGKDLQWDKMGRVGIASKRIRVIQFSPFDTALFFMGGEDCCGVVRSLDGSVRKKLPLGAAVWSAAWCSPDKVLMGLSNGKVMGWDTATMTTFDHPPSDNRIGITTVTRFEALDCTLIASLRSIWAMHGASVSSLLTAECIERKRVLDVSCCPESCKFVASFPHPSGSIHKLFLLTISQSQVECVQLGELPSPSSQFSYIWRNSLFRFAGSLCSLFFQEEKSRLVVHDWEQDRQDKYLTVGSGAKVTCLRPLHSDPHVCTAVALTQNELLHLKLSIV